MGIYLNPRNDGFQESINSEIYVDQTGLISYTNSVLDTEQRFVCVTRPRRFGKTMSAEMLVSYYCRACDSREQFQNLKIAQDESFEKHLNQYNVLFLNILHFLSQAKDAENVIDYLQEVVLEDFQEEYSDSIDFTDATLVDVLMQIYADTGTSFIFIIDEWDCIFREKKYDIELQMKYMNFLQLLLKDMPYVTLAYMTGILPIKKYGTQTGVNMFDEFTMTEPKRLAKYIGFTEYEVQALCEKYQMDFDETKRWYDGYQVAKGVRIYNPKSVVDAMRHREFHSYWVHTECLEALSVYIDMDIEGLKEVILQLLDGKRCGVDTRMFVNDMVTFADKDAVLTLLIHLGYLAYDVAAKKVYIPNGEIRDEFIHAIEHSGWEEASVYN